MASRVTQVAVEGLESATNSNARVTQVAVEAIESSTTAKAKVTQVAVEAIEQSTQSVARVTDIAVEVLWVPYQHTDSSFAIDSYIFAPTVNEFTVDAEISTQTRKRYFTVNAVTWQKGTQRKSFYIQAAIETRRFKVNAFVRPWFTIDARFTYGGSFKIQAKIASWFRAESIFKKNSGVQSFTIQTAPFVRGKLRINAVIRQPSFTVDATIEEAIYDSYGWGIPDGSGIKVGAFVTPTFTINAYILGTPSVVFDSSGTPSGTGIPPNRGAAIKIMIAIRHPEWWDSAAASYWYSAVTKMQTYVNRYERLKSMTTAQKAAYKQDLYTLDVDKRRYRLATECPVVWTDYTTHCIWSETSFTQQAKVAPGNFSVSLRGSFPEIKGGEEIYLEIDGNRMFGGYVAQVQQGYFFTNYKSPKTVLTGYDYNVLFDKLVVYNRPWTWENYYLNKSNGGEFQNWAYFPKGTMDRKIIVDTAKKFVDIPYGLNYGDYVDQVDTPAHVTSWMMPEPGSAWRTVMQSISQITSAVWWIDPYMNLQYHDRDALTPNRPAITDGAGGISSRDLVVSSDITQMVTENLVFGTLAATVSGSMVYYREIADGLQEVRFWTNAVNKIAKYISTLQKIANRTDEQEEALQTDLKTLAYDKKMLQSAKDNVTPSLVDFYGRWQYVEPRADFHHVDHVQRRAQSINSRYSKPIVRATATIYEDGYGAGQVVNVKSKAYGSDVNLVIRQMTIRFVASKGTYNGKPYAVPQYELSMGLDPEEPWTIYDYLPFEGINVGGAT